MGFKLGAFLVISAIAYAAQSAHAPCVCTRNYKPVCGSDGVTYSNECQLNCQRATRNATHDCLCPQNYSPVLGPDGVLYSNQCSLDCATRQSSGLELSHYGPCGLNVTDTPQEPPCVCSREGRPVCGSDGITYANDCLLNCATKDNSALSITYFGPCADSVMVVDG